MEDLGFSLRVAREKCGLTQMQVMKKTGINNKTLSGYENGLSEPDLTTLATLLQLYHVSADKLLHLVPELEASPQTEAEAELLSLYRSFRPEERCELLLALRTIAKHRLSSDSVQTSE
jgi:transcriptional regulator with XRE-family HTH domain